MCECWSIYMGLVIEPVECTVKRFVPVCHGKEIEISLKIVVVCWSATVEGKTRQIPY